MPERKQEPRRKKHPEKGVSDLDFKEKIEMEKDMYISYLLLNSRAALVEKAPEITVKCAIYDRLLSDITKLPDRFVKEMELVDGVADYLYLKYKGSIEIINGKITSLSWTKITGSYV